MAKLFDFSNDGYTYMGYIGARAVITEAEGWCFGYSTNWVTRMLKNQSKPKLSKPTKMDAGPLQQKIEMLSTGREASVKKVISQLGYTCSNPYLRKWDVLPSSIAKSSSGYYIVDIGDHWLGMGKGNGKFYYFDSNDGLYEYSDKSKFNIDVKAKVKSYKDDRSADNGFEENHRAYRIT